MSSYRTLVVDDELGVITLLENVLRSEGYAVDKATSGSAALDKIRRLAPDLVFLDLNLPDLGGLDVLERLLLITPGVLVVMMTGQGDVATAVQSMKLGAVDFIQKPFNLEQLKLTIQSLLPRETTRMESLTKPVIGKSPQMREVWLQISRYALPEVSILLRGESGTGKELFARAIHESSKRRTKQFVAVDCATLPDTLIESELFGYEKGAFTGALDQKLGKFELAQGGTIFLDEIGNLPLPYQAKLLRVVQERKVDRLGGNRPILLDIRVISATNLNLEKAIQKGTFRDDLYYRLAEVVIRLPPLRERENDVEAVATYFVQEFNRRFDREVLGFSESAWTVLRDYRWPGNVRELENVVRSSLLAADNLIGIEHLPEYLRRPSDDLASNTAMGMDLKQRVHRDVDFGLEQGSLDLKELVGRYGEQIECAVLAELLGRSRYKQLELCALLKIDTKTLRAKLHKYGLRTKE